MLDLPTKMTRWLSDFLVGLVIQVNVNGFLSDKISPIAGYHTDLWAAGKNEQFAAKFVHKDL